MRMLIYSWIYIYIVVQSWIYSCTKLDIVGYIYIYVEVSNFCMSFGIAIISYLGKMGISWDFMGYITNNMGLRCQRKYIVLVCRLCSWQHMVIQTLV